MNPRAPARGEVHLWMADFGDWVDRLADLKSLLSLDEVDRSDRFLRDGDRDRYVFAHGVLRRILAASCGCDSGALAFDLGDHGKPFLADPLAGSEAIEFNLSHSGDLVLIGVTSCCPLGVDVERLSRKVEFEDLSDRFFSPEEAEAIRLHPEEERRRVFFDTWVCKEAFIKAVGDGLTMPLDSFAIRFDGERTMVGTSAGKENPHLRTPWFLDRFEVTSDYVGAVAASAETVAITGFRLQ
jgi:4'-phosphopantetheinyl transferase